jgi:hypothetical protein
MRRSIAHRSRLSQLLRALLLQAFDSIGSERQLTERLDFDLLLRWFVGLGIDETVWDHSTFSKNRDRLLAADVAAAFLTPLLGWPEVRRLLSNEHFSIHGTLIQGWASIKSFRPKSDADGPPDDAGRNGSRDFQGERRRNQTHASTTDPAAKLFRKGVARRGDHQSPPGTQEGSLTLNISSIFRMSRQPVLKRV